jgi:hypothetical protein
MRDRSSPSPVKKAALIAAILFAVIVAGIAAMAWLSSDDGNLPFAYQGFDQGK